MQVDHQQDHAAEGRVQTFDVRIPSFEQVVTAIRANKCRIIDDHRSHYPENERDIQVNAVARYGDHTVLIDTLAEYFPLNPITLDVENIPHRRCQSFGLLVTKGTAGIQHAIDQFNDPANYLPEHRKQMVSLTHLLYI
jgi:hypothetical protein